MRTARHERKLIFLKVQLEPKILSINPMLGPSSCYYHVNKHANEYGPNVGTDCIYQKFRRQLYGSTDDNSSFPQY